MVPEQNPALLPEQEDNNSIAQNEDEKLAKGEITNNDGSIIETLDTVFHGKPGWFTGENVSGSDRADYYEQRSQGKSDAEEELDAPKDQKPNT